MLLLRADWHAVEATLSTAERVLLLEPEIGTPVGDGVWILPLPPAHGMDIYLYTSTTPKSSFCSRLPASFRQRDDPQLAQAARLKEPSNLSLTAPPIVASGFRPSFPRRHLRDLPLPSLLLLKLLAPSK